MGTIRWIKNKKTSTDAFPIKSESFDRPPVHFLWKLWNHPLRKLDKSSINFYAQQLAWDHRMRDFMFLFNVLLTPWSWCSVNCMRNIQKNKNTVTTTKIMLHKIHENKKPDNNHSSQNLTNFSSGFMVLPPKHITLTYSCVEDARKRLFPKPKPKKKKPNLFLWGLCDMFHPYFFSKYY